MFGWLKTLKDYFFGQAIQEARSEKRQPEKNQSEEDMAVSEETPLLSDYDDHQEKIVSRSTAVAVANSVSANHPHQHPNLQHQHEGEIENDYPFSIDTQVSQGAGRDLGWALATYFNFDMFTPFLRKHVSQNNLKIYHVGDIVGPWTTQFIVGGAGLGIATAVTYVVNPNNRTPQGKAVLGLYAIASLGSLFLWNAMQLFGTDVGKDITPDDEDAQLIAAVFTGLGEGLFQYLIVLMGAYYLERNKSAKAKSCREAVMDQSLNCLANLPAGAVWQLLFVGLPIFALRLGLPQDDFYMTLVKNIVESFAIAGGVMLTSYASNKIATLFGNKVRQCFAAENDEVPASNFDV